MRGWVRGVGSVAAIFVLLGQTIYAEDATAIAARLQRTDAATALDAPGVAPWHMKMAVQLFDAKGQPGEQGIVEEWWSAPQSYRVVYAMPSYKATELQTSAGFFRTRGTEQPPLMLELLRDQVVHPMPPERDVAGTLAETRREKFGKAAFQCIMLDRPIKAKAYFPIGLFPTYCMDAGKDSLRAAYDYGSQLILRNDIETFQGRAVAKDVSIARSGLASAKGRVFKLELAAADDPVFAQGADLQPMARPLPVGAATMAATLLSHVKPVYPETAKDRNAGGTVTLQAVIGRDGHIAFIRVVAAPDLELGNAAMAAVKQWVYKPYRVDGEPVEVETTMIVSFSIAS